MTPAIAAVHKRDGSITWTRWFIECLPASDADASFVLVGGPDAEWSRQDIENYGESVRWYRLVEAETP